MLTDIKFMLLKNAFYYGQKLNSPYLKHWDGLK